jgi:uncharacterized phage-associated protein
VTTSEVENRSAGGTPYDPRSIFNLILEEADGRPITNLALQKLLYFAHGLHIMEIKEPLVSGYFEAWQYGPVHPAAFAAFKSAGKSPITFRATRRNVLTGEVAPLPAVADEEVRRRVRQVMTLFGRVTPGRLVDISHAPKAPWHFVVSKARESMTFGMRISNDTIRDLFQHHKVSVGPAPLIGEPSEDAPFSASA